MCLTSYGVVSLLLEHRDLGQPGPGRQQLGLASTPELVLPKHLAFLLGAPVNMVLEHTHAEGVPYILEMFRNDEKQQGLRGPAVVLGVVEAHLCRQKFVCPRPRASRTQCGSPWSPTSRFCPRW